MDLMIVIGVVIITLSKCDCIYLNNETAAKKINQNSEVSNEEGLWGPLIEEWTLSSKREKRVMRLPPTRNGYVVEDLYKDSIARDQKEAKVTGGKIISNANNFNNNVIKKPQMHLVAETDLYLLGAIEKLVYRLDFMEKRLRRVEEMMYYVMAGNRVDYEPCPDNFSRVGINCYLFGHAAGREADWKVASKFCKKAGGSLAEMETIEENQDLIAHIQINKHLKGKDFWTGGLNPGLLWIWSNSGRPVTVPGVNKSDNSTGTIRGDGRCLKLAYDPALRSYSYRGSDCSVRYSYICELPENSSSNEIKRIGRSNNILRDEL